MRGMHGTRSVAAKALAGQQQGALKADDGHEGSPDNETCILCFLFISALMHTRGGFIARCGTQFIGTGLTNDANSFWLPEARK